MEPIFTTVAFVATFTLTGRHVPSVLQKLSSA